MNLWTQLLTERCHIPIPMTPLTPSVQTQKCVSKPSCIDRAHARKSCVGKMSPHVTKCRPARRGHQLVGSTGPCSPRRSQRSAQTLTLSSSSRATATTAVIWWPHHDQSPHEHAPCNPGAAMRWLSCADAIERLHKQNMIIT